MKREKNKLLKEIEKKNYELECFIHDFVEKKIIFNDGSNEESNKYKINEWRNKFIGNKIKEEREFSKKILMIWKRLIKLNVKNYLKKEKVLLKKMKMMTMKE